MTKKYITTQIWKNEPSKKVLQTEFIRGLDDLEVLQKAYESLGVMAGDARVGSENVADVMGVLSEKFGEVQKTLEKFRGSIDGRRA